MEQNYQLSGKISVSDSSCLSLLCFTAASPPSSWKYFWISSSVLPFVSGTRNPMMRVPTKARSAKLRYDPLAPIHDSRVGENLTTVKEQNQLKEAHIDDELDLACLENSSAFMTQGRGPIPME